MVGRGIGWMVGECGLGFQGFEIGVIKKVGSNLLRRS